MSARLAEPDAILWIVSVLVGAPAGSVGKRPETIRPHPATIVASGTNRDHPVAMPVEAIPSPSATVPAPSVMNEAVMIGPYGAVGVLAEAITDGTEVRPHEVKHRQADEGQE